MSARSAARSKQSINKDPDDARSNHNCFNKPAMPYCRKMHTCNMPLESSEANVTELRVRLLLVKSCQLQCWRVTTALHAEQHVRCSVSFHRAAALTSVCGACVCVQNKRV
mmetsp:Transcript_7413/g.12331  ORF Transcript_7413/g.12331 Transcript_7413/m.12331 type:complete len:110 (-) Transcript_7413:189-518(-)